MTAPRHQCLVYEGSRAAQLPALAAAIRDKLAANYRCLYLHDDAMLFAVQTYLAAAGVDVAQERDRKRLVLSSDRSFVIDGRLDTGRMMRLLQDAINSALADGHAGLFCTGDVAWEFGSEHDVAKLLDYEAQLEKLFSDNPSLSGICQYHADHLPAEVVSGAIFAHPGIFIDETPSRENPLFGKSMPV